MWFAFVGLSLFVFHKYRVYAVYYQNKYVHKHDLIRKFF